MSLLLRVELSILRAVASSEEATGLEVAARVRLGSTIYVWLTCMEFAGLVSSRKRCVCGDAECHYVSAEDHRRYYRITEAGRAALAEVDGVETYRGPR